jgi:BlaI family penicillinase repressor
VPAISEAEWVVMGVVWKQNPITANQVVQALGGTVAWKPKTIHTLLRRLVQKRALDFEKKGREFHFHPLVASEHCVHAASRSFLDRFFAGRVAPFLSCFLEKETVSRAEIEELRRILDHMP